jgi:hypothetical protein
MCVCGWPLVIVTALLELLVIGYGEIRAAMAMSARQDAAERAPARHRTGEPVSDLRARHDTDNQPYYPTAPRKTT